jgi:hypothetical protein
MIRIRMILAAALAAGLCAGAQAQSAAIVGKSAVLRGLDKVTGQTTDFTAPIGKTVKFNTLDVTVRACQKAAPEEPPATWVYLAITETPAVKKGEDKQPAKAELMKGWMLAQSPALLALEHPVYDIWAIDCKA